MCICAFTPPASAEITKPSNQLVTQAKVRNLAHDPYWIALMHYHSSTRFGVTNLVSEIRSADFFLSQNGATDSFAELTATLDAFFDEPGDNPDEHAQCKFVARYNWLRKTLDWSGLMPPEVTCRNYDLWSMQGKVESLSLVFATGYLSNPASFYGHILLKFNSSASTFSSDYLDQSINFGAIVPPNENGAIYVFKGLFGGYDATFSNAQFYRINHTYAEGELRDLWEYRLNLDDDQVRQIVAHSWELLGKKFKYYFLKENCAYRMGELLEVVVKQPVLPKELPWAMPATVFNRIDSIRSNGVPLVQSVKLIPSRLNRYYAKYSRLSDRQKSAAGLLAAGTTQFDNSGFVELGDQEKVAITDTLLDYVEFRLVGDKGNPNLKTLKQRLLVERIKLPSEPKQTKEPIQQFPGSSPPHDGPLPGMIRLGAVHNANLGSGTYFQVRPAYFDVLEPDSGRVPNSHLTMFDLSAVYLDHQFSIRNLDLVNIENFNVAKTPLPGDGGLAWKFRTGFRSVDLGCTNCLVFNMTGGLGKSYEISEDVVAYGMVDLSVQSGHHGPPLMGLDPQVGLVVTPRPFWKFRLSVGQTYYLDSQLRDVRLLRWENRFGINRNWDVRINLEQNRARELQMAISTYW